MAKKKKKKKAGGRGSTASKRKANIGTIAAVGALGIGAYLLWREMSEEPPASSVMVSTGVPYPMDTMMPSSAVPAASGVATMPQIQTLQPQAQTSSDQVPAGTMPSQYPYGQQAQVPQQQIPQQQAMLPQPQQQGMSREQMQQAYLAAIGNPKYGATVTGPFPPPGLFDAYPENKAPGPRQKKCLKKGGQWTGPTGKKFCVLPG